MVLDDDAAGADAAALKLDELATKSSQYRATAKSTFPAAASNR